MQASVDKCEYIGKKCLVIRGQDWRRLMEIFRLMLIIMENWIGKTAIVTGASSGIGKAIVKVFVEAGINVIGLARREDRLQALFKLIKGSNGSFHPMRCDLQNESDIVKVFDYIENNLNGIDILVNNAGICYTESIIDGNTNNLRAILEVNVLAAAICTKEAIKSIRKHNTEAHIFNINSVLGRHATLASAPTSLYPASKFALHAMTENLRQEIRLNKDKVKITAIYPGLVKTEILEGCSENISIYNKLPHIQSQDIADAILYALAAPPHVQVEEIKITPLHQKL